MIAGILLKNKKCEANVIKWLKNSKNQSTEIDSQVFPILKLSVTLKEKIKGNKGMSKKILYSPHFNFV